jgi:hypothetical protein
MKRSIFWDMTAGSPLQVCLRWTQELSSSVQEIGVKKAAK